ncbi:MAG: isoprenyl transferase [candidate division WOR-3 bacterium]
MSEANIPRHLAIIMDGNGRWATQRGLPRIMGHRAGIESVREIVRACRDVGIEWLTLFTFSSENWKRPPDEVSFLMNMLKELLARETEELDRNGVRIRCMGRIKQLPQEVQDELMRSIEKTKNNTSLNLVLALSYGGQAEIADAARTLAERALAGELDPGRINEDTFQNFLYIPEMPPVDLLIRTSMELRISNFMLWQTAYAELYFTETLWPDFRKPELLNAIEDFARRERRFGGI